jgi:RimJ/RimL family protein N-acetyltransferase
MQEHIQAATAQRQHRLAIEQLGPEDHDRIAAHFLTLSDDDRQLRFRCAADADWIGRYVAQIDFARQTLLALVAPDGSVAGLLQICRFRTPGGRCAELAFSVDPAHRGLGLGHRLMSLALAHAQTVGIGRLATEVAPANRPMRAVLEAAGMEFTREDDDLIGTLAVVTQPVRLAA